MEMLCSAVRIYSAILHCWYTLPAFVNAGSEGPGSIHTILPLFSVGPFAVHCSLNIIITNTLLARGRVLKQVSKTRLDHL